MHISSQSLTRLVITLASCVKIVSSDVNVDTEQEYLSLIGNTNFEQHPTYFEDLKAISQHKYSNWSDLGIRRASETDPDESPVEQSNTDSSCEPEDVDLTDYPQWNAEIGYWIGEYTFLDKNGNPYVSESWNYPYDQYRGFITGYIRGNKYRQRNVFLYPPQKKLKCRKNESSTVGDGTCGKHGNTKVFMADQTATTCSDNPELGGDIQGPYQRMFKTQTELIGRNNALLYQVYLDKEMFGLQEDRLYQSQLTTLTTDDSGNMFRTRTAQGFPFAGSMASNYASYYRERKVSKVDFYRELRNTKAEFNIRSIDMCAWKNDMTGKTIPTGSGNFKACKLHLEESFKL